MTTDLKSMTVEELCEKALYTRLAAYEIARRLEEAQQKIAEAKAEALEEWQVLYRKAFDPEQTLAIHALNNAGAKAAEYRANSGRKE